MLTSETVGTGGPLLACVNQPPARAGVTNEDAQAAIAKSATRSEDVAKSFVRLKQKRVVRMIWFQ